MEVSEASDGTLVGGVETSAEARFRGRAARGRVGVEAEAVPAVAGAAFLGLAMMENIPSHRSQWGAGLGEQGKGAG